MSHQGRVLDDARLEKRLLITPVAVPRVAGERDVPPDEGDAAMAQAEEVLDAIRAPFALSMSIQPKKGSLGWKKVKTTGIPRRLKKSIFSSSTWGLKRIAHPGWGSTRSAWRDVRLADALGRSAG
jgi:hypothetical protein